MYPYLADDLLLRRNHTGREIGKAEMLGSLVDALKLLTKVEFATHGAPTPKMDAFNSITCRAPWQWRHRRHGQSRPDQADRAICRWASAAGDRH
jgi:hypothetical protein